MVNPGAPLSYTGTLAVPAEGDYTFVFSPPTYGPLSIDGSQLLFCILEPCSGSVCNLTAGQQHLGLGHHRQGADRAPSPSEPVSPMKIEAGKALNQRKPMQAPTRQAESRARFSGRW